jgi:hypothetical protein
MRDGIRDLIWATYLLKFTILETLTKYVGARLEKRAFCVVFEADLERCWPRKDITRLERESEIQNFAESQGWTAAVVEGAFGTRAIFQRLKFDGVDYKGSSLVPN